MSLMMGLISYLPDEESRAKRWSCTKECIENFWKIAVNSGSQLLIVLTNWKEEKEWLKDKGIKFIEVQNESRGVAKSRNIILNEFYSSDADYLWLSDDDVFWDSSTLASGLINILNIKPEKLIQKGIYVFNGVPFVSEIPQAKLTFKSVFGLFGGLMFIINCNKYFGLKIFQRHYLQSLGLGGEDVLFEFEFTSALNCRSFFCNNLKYRLMETPSVFWQKKSSEQRKRTEDFLKNISFERGGEVVNYLQWINMPTYSQQKVVRF